MRVLAISASFAPGFRGGSFKALTCMVERLDDRCEFRVLARDRDPGQRERLAVEVDGWTDYGRAQVYYSTRPHHPALVARVVADTQPDVLFLNSLYTIGSIAVFALRRAGRIRIPVVVAPEGELAPGGLAQKPSKKRAYLTALRLGRVMAGVTWMARDAGEQADIAREFPGAPPARIVPCLGPGDVSAPALPLAKAPGSLRLLFLSRITPKKNLAFLLEVLADHAGGPIDLDIVGNVDDAAYWSRCQHLIARLPATVRARYQGEATPAEVAGWMARAHTLVLPTLGENYGYVVAEALECGRPVLISDHTPWHDLQARGSGWVVPLTPDAWRAAIAGLLTLSDAEYQTRCLNARAHAEDAAAAADVERETLDLLRQAAGTPAPAPAD